MHYLYIIYSYSANKYYVGETVDVSERLQQHKSGYYAGSYTKQAIDWELKLVLEFDNISQARKAEAFIKRMNSRKFTEKLIEDSAWLVKKFKI
jgi:putative endonuclease